MPAGPPPHPSNLAAGDRLACRRAATHPWLSPPGVASLAATSLAAMVATSELLVESFDYPVSGPVDPPVPDLGRPGVLQVEPPRQGRVKPPLAAPGDPRPSRRRVPRRLTAAPRRTTVAPAWSWPCSGARRARSRSRATGRPWTSTRRDPRAGPCCLAPAAHPPRASLAASTPEALDRPQAAPRRDGDRRHRDEGERRTGEPRRPDTAQDQRHDGGSPVGSGDGSQPPSHRQKGWPTGSR